MKTEKEVRDYLEFCKIERDDVLRICAYLEGKGIKLVRFTRTIIDEPEQLKYDDFVQWFNEYDENIKEVEINIINPKYPIGTKVKLYNQKNIFEVKAISKGTKSNPNGGYRYDIVSGNCKHRFVRESKLEKYKDKVEPKFKVGDWVRVVNIGKAHASYFEMFYKMGFRKIPKDTPEILARDLTKHHIEYGKIFAVEMHEYFQNCCLYGIEFEDKQLLIGESGIELYEPKEGEFVLVEFNDDEVGHRKAIMQVKKWGTLIYDSASLFISDNWVFCKSESSFCNLSNISYFRPATGEEKQVLIKAVEDKYNKTYCEETKQWVDVKPKSAIDEFNEKQEVRIKRGKDGMFNVYVGDFCTDFLSYDEMLGTVAALLTPPDIRERKCLNWLKTKEQHLAGRCISAELREEMGITDEEYETICNRQQ